MRNWLGFSGACVEFHTLVFYYFSFVTVTFSVFSLQPFGLMFSIVKHPVKQKVISISGNVFLHFTLVFVVLLQRSKRMSIEAEALLQEAKESIEAAQNYRSELQQRLHGLSQARKQV